MNVKQTHIVSEMGCLRPLAALAGVVVGVGVVMAQILRQPAEYLGLLQWIGLAS